MNWLAKAKAHFSKTAQAPTAKTGERGVLSVSSVGVTGIFQNCISVEDLIAAAMRACDHHGDSAAARQQMVKDCLNTQPELRKELLDYFSTNYPRPTP